MLTFEVTAKAVGDFLQQHRFLRVVHIFYGLQHFERQTVFYGFPDFNFLPVHNEIVPQDRAWLGPRTKL